MKIPVWSTEHLCDKNIQGFFECVDCGAMTNRINSKQCRCPSCQSEHKRVLEMLRKKNKRSNGAGTSPALSGVGD